MRRLVLVSILALSLAACGRESSVDLASGSAEEGAADESTVVDVPEESEDDSWAREPAVDETFEDASESATDDEPSPEPTATRAGTRPRPPANSGSSAGSAGGGSQPSQPGQHGATTPPSQGIDVGEPNPNDPDGCPECPVSSPTEEPGTAPGGGGYTNPAPGQDDVRAREWESAQVQSDDQTIVITWWSGVEPCYVLDHVEVKEEADRIVVTLYEGSQPGFEGACTEQAVKKQTEVRTTTKVAGRPIVDGAKK